MLNKILDFLMLSLKVYLKAGDNTILIFKLNYQLLLTYDKNLIKINYLSFHACDLKDT